MTHNELMRPFWNRVNKMMIVEGHDLRNGYFEIKAHNIIYRSVFDDIHGGTIWVSWEPFKVINHFSYLSDPEGTIKWVEHEKKI